jgi:hypothetical protein
LAANTGVNIFGYSVRGGFGFDLLGMAEPNEVLKVFASPLQVDVVWKRQILDYFGVKLGREPQQGGRRKHYLQGPRVRCIVDYRIATRAILRSWLGPLLA